MVSPVFTSSAKNDRVGDEITRLGKAGLPIPGRVPGVILGKDPEAHPMDQPASPLDIGIELTTTERNDYAKLAAGLESKVTLHDSLSKLMSDERYRDGNDAKRSTLLMGVINAYREAAVPALLKKHPALMDVYKERQRAKAGAFSAPPTNAAPRGALPNIQLTPR